MDILVFCLFMALLGWFCNLAGLLITLGAAKETPQNISPLPNVIIVIGLTIPYLLFLIGQIVAFYGAWTICRNSINEMIEALRRCEETAEMMPVEGDSQ